MLTIATWNVNSVKIRLEQVTQWMQTHAVDVLALQETKITDEQFPREHFEALGYHLSFSGQKSYNGVAVISRYPLSDVVMDIDFIQDPQRRILAVTVEGIRLLNLYVPNGSHVGSDKYHYKLSWLDGIYHYLKKQLEQCPHVAVVGDFNIAPDDHDVHDPDLWEGSILVSPKEREAYQRLLSLGLYDGFRHMKPNEREYSWWDYRAGSFHRNHGLRIDHMLMTGSLMTQCSDLFIDKIARKHPRPSDHAPVLAVLTWTKEGQ